MNKTLLVCAISFVFMPLLLVGCGGADLTESTRLLKEASNRIEDLEGQLSAEHMAFSNRCSQLSRDFETEQLASQKQVVELKKRLADTKREVQDLRKSSMALQGYVTLLQQRIDTIRETETEANKE